MSSVGPSRSALPNLARVAQEDAYGCGLATLAMLTGHSYDQVKRNFDAWDRPSWDWDKSGCTHIEVDRYLGWQRMAVIRKYGAWYPSWERVTPEPFAPLHYAQVQQPSNSNHFVVMLADGAVLDPYREGVYSLSDWPVVNQLVGVFRV